MGFSVRRGRGGVHVGRRLGGRVRVAMEIEDEDGCAAATCAAATDPARIELETRPKCVEDAHGYAMYLSRATIPAIGVKERETMPAELDLTPTKWQDKDREIRLSRPHTHVLGAVCYDAAYLRFFVDDKAEPTPLQRMENIDAAHIGNRVWSQGVT